jgi:Holliday junction resolvase RusA-like endonuclease
MSKKLFIQFDSIPPRATAQSKGVFVVGGKPRFFKKAKQAREENNTVALLMAKKPKGFVPFDGPISVWLCLVWPYRKSEKKSVVARGGLVPMDVRPDADNLAKMMLDAIGAAGYWRDDAQVATLTVCKTWGPVGHWTLAIEPEKETT